MNTRLRFLSLAALIAVLLVPSSGLALEKATARMTDIEPDGTWRGSSTCSVSYYNTCTGWIWQWNGWSPSDQLGTTFNACCPGGTAVTGAQIYAWTGSPSGYGFTGSMDLFNADGDLCPTGAALASVPLLPVSGWNAAAFGGGSGVPVAGSNFSVVVTMGTGSSNPVAFVTDHPAAGPTGPAACGSCFPTTRAAHSFYWGTPTTPVCPGSPLFDGICDAELFSFATMICTTPVESSTWGQVKNLYR
jgi:hypothetical protein